MFGFRKKPVDDGKSLAQPLPEGLHLVDLGLLGSGGVARVYRVRDEVLHREVALKVLRPELMTEKIAIENFVNEARITAELDHPNIPAVYAMASDKKRSSVFTMKVLEGQTLQQLLDENVRQKIDGLSAAIEVLLRICDAVAFAHSRGVLHLDIKPSNIIVAGYGQIYLVDWGFARRKAELPKGPGEPIEVEGTPGYLASTFHELDRQLALQRQQSRVVELALRYVTLHGEGGRTPWKPLHAMLTQSTGASEADVSSWVLGAAGFAMEDESLVLRD